MQRSGYLILLKRRLIRDLEEERDDGGLDLAAEWNDRINQVNVCTGVGTCLELGVPESDLPSLLVLLIDIALEDELTSGDHVGMENIRIGRPYA